MSKKVFTLSDQIWAGLTSEEIDATVEAMKACGVYELPFEGDLYVRCSMIWLAAVARSNSEYAKMISKDYDEVKAKYRHSIERKDRYIELNIRFDYDYQNNPPPICTILFSSKHKREEDANWVEKWSVATDPPPAVRAQLIRTQGFDRTYFWPADEARDIISRVRDALIVILASKGVIKTTRETGKLNRLLGKPAKLTDGDIVTTITLAEVSRNSYQGGTHASPRLHLRRGHSREQRYGVGNGLMKLIFIEPTWINADAEFMVKRTAYRVKP